MFKKAAAFLPILLTSIFILLLAFTFFQQRGKTYDLAAKESHDSLWLVDSKVNINTANAAMLRQIPGIKTKVAARIVEYREKNGAFRDVRELINVKGFTPEMLEEISEYITVGDVK